jgi:hypothetical protein
MRGTARLAGQGVVPHNGAMSRAQAFAMLSVLFAPAIAQACPAMAEAGCAGASMHSMLTYVVLFGGGLLAGIGSIAMQRRGGER